jgi:heme-degrading monooxygenase HmoA
MSKHAAASILFLIRFRSALAPEELVRRYRARLPEFRALPGLIQKYYVHDPSTDEWGGFYHWESREALQVYLASDLRKSIPQHYEIIGEPRIETLEVLETLRS